MEPCLEIDPSKYVLVIGPSFTKTVLQELQGPKAFKSESIGECMETAATTEAAAQRSPSFDLGNIVNEGIGILLESEDFQSEEDRLKCEVLYKNAYELDPLFAYRKVAANLQKLGKYADWLKRSFEVHLEAPHNSPSLSYLLELQKKGALLLYAHCDDVLSKASNTLPILLEDQEALELWYKGEREGFLHVHGVYWEPYTVKIDCEVYENQAHQMKPALEGLKQVFEERHRVMIGFDDHSSDPLLTKFLEKFIANSGGVETSKHSFQLLTQGKSVSELHPTLPICTALRASSEGEVPTEQCSTPINSSCIYPLTESSTSLCK